jgi:hypothetical protein
VPRANCSASSDAAAIVDFPDREASTTWLFALYGATMLSVQRLEQEISLLYAIVGVDPGRRSNASSRRQVLNGFRRSWQAFQRGSSGMKLNDAKVGIKPHLDATLYDEVDAFIRGPRNQLAHRFLIERVVGVSRHGLPVLAQSSVELIRTHQEATRLGDLLRSRSDEVLATWPETEEPPDEIKQHLEVISRMTILKEFPPELLRDGGSSDA